MGILLPDSLLRTGKFQFDSLDMIQVRIIGLLFMIRVGVDRWLAPALAFKPPGSSRGAVCSAGLSSLSSNNAPRCGWRSAAASSRRGARRPSRTFRTPSRTCKNYGGISRSLNNHLPSNLCIGIEIYIHIDIRYMILLLQHAPKSGTNHFGS